MVLLVAALSRGSRNRMAWLSLPRNLPSCRQTKLVTGQHVGRKEWIKSRSDYIPLLLKMRPVILILTGGEKEDGWASTHRLWSLRWVGKENSSAK